MDRSDAKTLEVEREHSRYENALHRIEDLSNRGIEKFSKEDKDTYLREIREAAAEALEG